MFLVPFVAAFCYRLVSAVATSCLSQLLVAGGGKQCLEQQAGFVSSAESVLPQVMTFDVCGGLKQEACVAAGVFAGGGGKVIMSPRTRVDTSQ